MRSMLDSVHTGSSSLGTHYTEILRATLTTLWRRKLLVVSMVAGALSLGTIAALEMPKQYTAVAFIHGGFMAPDLVTAAQGNTGVSVGFDASQLVETQSRLLQSHQLSRLVVKRLGLGRVQTMVGKGSVSTWLRSALYGDVIQTPAYQNDEAAMRLSRGLSVKTEPRVYLIGVSYTAGDPAWAAIVVNTFVAEFLRNIELQKLNEQKALAKSQLSEKLETFGEKYPQVSEARTRLVAADSLLQAELNKNPEEILQAAGQKIVLAQANAVPSSPKPPVIIGISLLAGLVAGVGIAVYFPAKRTGAPRQREIRSQPDPV